MGAKIKWPDNKTFAFTIFDDTDYATLDKVKDVYAFFNDLGLHTSKSVWPISGKLEPICGGSTCQDTEYLGWLQNLQKSDFEISYHMNTFHSSTRDEIQDGLKRFVDMFGHPPATMANHTGCLDDIYWGEYRLSGLNRVVYNLLTHFRNKGKFRGHIKNDPYFWGDICGKNIKYCRNFVYQGINTLKECPFMPYHDPDRPYINYWFASSEGAHIKSFNKLLSEDNQDKLEDDGGACIVYTHLACGFYENGKLNSRFIKLMERLAKKKGWFVPTAVLLDYLLDLNGHHEITAKERNRLERKWLYCKIRKGTS